MRRGQDLDSGRRIWACPFTCCKSVVADISKGEPTYDFLCQAATEALILAKADTLLLADDVLLIPAVSAQDEHIAEDDSDSEVRNGFTLGGGMVAQEAKRKSSPSEGGFRLHKKAAHTSSTLGS